jgi:amidohydrolase
VARHLEDLGLEVKTGLAGHGVVGVLRGFRPGKTVALRADMDALPLSEEVESPWRSRVEGVMHACGHDFHLSIALAAAHLLSHLKEELAGEIRFIFQPAEEVPLQGKESGARGMVAAGVLDNPRVSAILALHVASHVDAGQIRYCPDVVMAGADRLLLTITGKAVHGATPYRGVDSVLVGAQAITQIHGFLAQGIDRRQGVVLTFGRVSGGSRFNILADRVTLEGSLRYLKEGARQEALQGIRRLLAGLSHGSGAEIDLAAEPVYPLLKNHPDLTRQAVKVLGAVLGPERLSEHQPAMGSEDFSYYAAQVPAFYFFLGVRTPGQKGQALHAADFNPDEAALPWGLRAAAALLAALSEPES